MSAFILGVPARQGGGLKGEPVSQSDFMAEREDVAIPIESVVVDAAGLGFDARPFDCESPVGATQRHVLLKVVAIVGVEAEAVA